MATAEQTIIQNDAQPLACYNQFRAQLANLAAENASLVFNYADEKGAKQARSHIYKLRRTKSAVDDARVAEKKSALEYGRRVDSEAREIVQTIEEMIAVHQTPLDEIENREKARVAALEARVNALTIEIDDAPDSVEDLRKFIARYDQTVIDESFDEYMAPATKAKNLMLLSLNNKLKRAIEAEELTRLRAEKEAADRAERERKIAEEAAEKAQRDAEAKIHAESERAARAEKALEQNKIDSEKREREAIARAEQERIAKENAERKEREKREKDKEHRQKINNEILEDFLPLIDQPDSVLKRLITAIATGEVRHVRIEY